MSGNKISQDTPLYLLCAYRTSFDEYPPVYIIGLYESIDEAECAQDTECGRTRNKGNVWYGRNGIISWIKQIKIGTSMESIDVRNPSF